MPMFSARASERGRQGGLSQDALGHVQRHPGRSKGRSRHRENTSPIKSGEIALCPPNHCVCRLVPSEAERRKLFQASPLPQGACCNLRHSLACIIEASSPSLAPSSGGLLPVIVCLCPNFPFDKDTCHMGPWPTLMNSPQPDDLCKDPLSK